MRENKLCSNCEYWNSDNGFCSVKMIITSRKEHCEYWSDEEYIQALEKENQMLKEKIVGISALLYRMNEYMEDMDLIIKWRNNNE